MTLLDDVTLALQRCVPAWAIDANSFFLQCGRFLKREPFPILCTPDARAVARAYARTLTNYLFSLVHL